MYYSIGYHTKHGKQNLYVPYLLIEATRIV